MNLDIGEIAKVLGVGAAVAMVLAASAYTALKVLRSDKTIAGVITRIEEERDYYRDTLTREREEAKVEREALRGMLEQQGADATRERAILRGQNDALMRQVETLREEMQVLVLQPGIPGPRGLQGIQGIQGDKGEHE